MRERVYLALVHHPTVDRGGAVVATAVTTLDLHDFARLARTYGLGGVYATTPLEGQRDLVASLLGHWLEGQGGVMNPSRREALKGLRVVGDLAEARAAVADCWGAEPLVVGTSARDAPGRLGFREGRRWLEGVAEPVLLVFGTGWGLAPEALGQCGRVLEPIRGSGDYNHLSVRSAASVAVDRLFGDW